MGRESEINVANKVAQHLEAARSPTRLADRWGRPIQEGAKYELHLPEAPLVTIVDIEPVRDLNLPAGLRKITLEVVIMVSNLSRVSALTLIALAEKPISGTDDAGNPEDPRNGDSSVEVPEVSETLASKASEDPGLPADPAKPHIVLVEK